MQVFEKNDVYFPGVALGEVVPLPLPKQGCLQRLNVVSSTASFTATLLSRPVDNLVSTLTGVYAGNGGFATLRFKYPHPYTLRDMITVAGTSVSGYHTTHTVVGSPSAYEVQTDQPYTADATGGTGTLYLSVSAITAGAVGRAVVYTNRPHIFIPGEQITVAGASVSGYNVTHVITRVLSELAVETATAFTSVSTGGTVVLATGTTAKTALYEMAPALSGTSNVGRYEATYPRPYHLNKPYDVMNSASRPIQAYLKLSAAGDYWVSVAGIIQ